MWASFEVLILFSKVVDLFSFFSFLLDIETSGQEEVSVWRLECRATCYTTTRESEGKREDVITANILIMLSFLTFTKKCKTLEER